MSPVLIHETRKRFYVSFLERIPALHADGFDKIEVRQHRRVTVFGARSLFVQYLIGSAGIAGEEHHEVFLEVVEGFGRDRERDDLDTLVLMELEAVDATEGCYVLILFADGPGQPVDLDVASFFRQRARRHHFAFVSVNGSEQADGKCSRRTESGSRRDVGQADDFDRGSDGMQAQGLPHDRVSDVVDHGDPLERGVFQEIVVGERRIDTYKDVLVDGRGEDHPPRSAVVGREVRPPAAKRDTERRPGDDHRRSYSSYPASVASRREHPDGVERNLCEIPPQPMKLLQEVVRHRDDVAPDRVGLDDVQHFRGLAHRSSTFGFSATISSAAAMSGTGSRPVSATRPAKTDTIAP